MTEMTTEIEGKGITFSYAYEGSREHALENVDIRVQKGEFAAILGHNGCGKSTLVKHFNALYPLQQGSLMVAGLDVREEGDVWELRRRCGMVFQNPDNQFVSSIVEEDIAFGLENYDTPAKEIPGRVAEALQRVGLSGYEKRAPHQLSGGQKQRIALAGVLAMRPELLIFDEVTSMLDPEGRQEILQQMRSLQKSGKTVVMITHYVEETLDTDQIYLMKQGKLLGKGTPREILTNTQLLREAGILPPIAVRLYEELKQQGIVLKHCPLTKKELVEELCQL